MDHVVDGPAEHRRCCRRAAATWPGSRSAPAAAGPAAAAGQVRRLRLVGHAVAPGAARPGRGRAGSGAAHRLGRPAGRAAGVPGRLLGRAPTSSSTATPRSSRRCGSRCSTCCRPAPGPRAGDPGQGPDRARLRRARLLGHRDLRAAGADLHPARRPRADALRWRHATLGRARERARQLGLRGAGFPWRTIRGEECSGYWPAGTAAFHVNADIADAVIRYTDATGDDAVRRGHRAWTCWSRPPGCGARWATTTPAAGSASTASPARTSTAPSPTTTSTPT